MACMVLKMMYMKLMVRVQRQAKELRDGYSQWVKTSKRAFHHGFAALNIMKLT